MGCCRKARKWVTGITGVILIALGGAFYPLIDMGTIAGLKSDNVLKPDAALYEGLFAPSLGL